MKGAARCDFWWARGQYGIGIPVSCLLQPENHRMIRLHIQVSSKKQGCLRRRLPEALHPSADQLHTLDLSLLADMVQMGIKHSDYPAGFRFLEP
ncbi:hypothetical protein D3C75_1039000 [compost metagenome]